ncbi:23630_t:CDS:2, partial [Gigaspora margarita]
YKSSKIYLYLAQYLYMLDHATSKITNKLNHAIPKIANNKFDYATSKITFVKKAATIDYMNKILEPSLKNSMKVKKKTLIDYQKSAEIDEAREMKLGLKEAIMNNETLNKSNCKMLVRDYDKYNKGKNINRTKISLKEEALYYTCKK